MVQLKHQESTVLHKIRADNHLGKAVQTYMPYDDNVQNEV